MATYNGAKFVGEQLASLARQTLMPCELVVCDDGSTDETVDVVRSFAREAPFAVRLEPNHEHLGYADTFLRAATLCRGDAIAFCDQDDVWLDRKLERCADVLAATGAILACHTAHVVDEKLRMTGRTHPRITRTRVLDPLRADPRFVIQGSSFLFDAALLSIADHRSRPRALNPDLPRMGHDTWVYLLADVTGKIALLAEPLALYRQHAANAFGAGETSVRALLGQSLLTGGGTYRRYAVLWQEWADVLGRLAEKEGDALARARYRRATKRFARLSASFERRAELYEPGLSYRSRIRLLAGLAARRGYRSHVHGGLGLRALAKDVVVTAAGRNTVEALPSSPES